MTVAAGVQGAVGFGGNLLAAPIVVLIDPELVPGPLLVGAFVLTFLMTVREPESADLRELGWAYTGRVAGTVAGALALLAVPTDDLQLFFGLLILAAVALTASGIHLAINRPSLCGTGLLSGFMATTVSIGGPPMALLYQHEGGGMLRGTLSRFLTVGTTISVLTLALIGEFGTDDAVASLALVPGTLVGFALSGRLTGHLDRGHTRTAVLVVAGVAGTVALVRSLS